MLRLREPGRPALTGRPLFFGLLLASLAASANAATFDEFLALGGKEFAGLTGSTFLPGIVWDAQPEQAYYECKDRLDRTTLQLWQQAGAWVSPRGADPAPLLYGRHGSMRVFSMTGPEGEPAVAAYFMLASGDTHVFRIKEGNVALSSIRWQCDPAPWIAIPSKNPGTSGPAEQ